MRMTSMHMSFTETVSDNLCRNSLVCKPIVAAAVWGGWSQTILEFGDAGCGGPGLVWLHVVCGCEAG